MTKSEIRDLIITGNYMIGDDGIREPIDWEDYANKLEEILTQNEGALPSTSQKGNVETCKKCQSLAKHKISLIEENEVLRQRLIDAGLEKPAIIIDPSRLA
jgi:hypothetical protein